MYKLRSPRSPRWRSKMSDEIKVANSLDGIGWIYRQERDVCPAQRVV